MGSCPQGSPGSRGHKTVNNFSKQGVTLRRLKTVSDENNTCIRTVWTQASCDCLGVC